MPEKNYRRAFALAASIIASSMGFIDGTVVHIALPSIQQDLGASFASLQWIANTYLLALCALLVISGALGDRYGPRRLFLIGIAGFTLSSAACAAAPGSTMLIVARTLQGISAALMLPQSLSIIARLYPPEQRGRAVGIWSASASASAAVGPVIGGFLVDNGGWPYAFWVNLPLGVIAFVLTLYAVPRANKRKQVPLDWPGAVLLVLGLGASVFATINLSLYKVSSIYVWPGWVIGLCAFACFIVWERRAPAPILPIHFSKNREFVLLNIYCLLVFTTFTAMMFMVPYLLITSIGLSASLTALNILPLGVFVSLMARPAGTIADKVGYRTPMIYGAFVIALATALSSAIVWLRADWSGAVFMTMLGIGAGLMVTPLTTGVLNSVNTEESGLASGINHAVTRIGNLLSIAIFGVILALRYQHYLADTLKSAVADSSAREMIYPVVHGSASTLAQTDLSLLPVELHALTTTAMTRALDSAFVEVMLLASLCSIAAAWCAMKLNSD